MNFEVETAFPCAARFRVVGKRDAGSDAPAGVRFVGGHGDMASQLVEKGRQLATFFSSYHPTCSKMYVG